MIQNEKIKLAVGILRTIKGRAITTLSQESNSKVLSIKTKKFDACIDWGGTTEEVCQKPTALSLPSSQLLHILEKSNNLDFELEDDSIKLCVNRTTRPYQVQVKGRKSKTSHTSICDQTVHKKIQFDMVGLRDCLNQAIVVAAQESEFVRFIVWNDGKCAMIGWNDRTEWRCKVCLKEQMPTNNHDDVFIDFVVSAEAVRAICADGTVFCCGKPVVAELTDQKIRFFAPSQGLTVTTTLLKTEDAFSLENGIKSENIAPKKMLELYITELREWLDFCKNVTNHSYSPLVKFTVKNIAEDGTAELQCCCSDARNDKFLQSNNIELKTQLLISVGKNKDLEGLSFDVDLTTLQKTLHSSWSWYPGVKHSVWLSQNKNVMSFYIHGWERSEIRSVLIHKK